jgi:hypothetical protein
VFYYSDSIDAVASVISSEDLEIIMRYYDGVGVEEGRGAALAIM